ncbi:TetR/AcrR family transcriptional regulator [Nocardia sp. NBC_01327]|uniref:TetR/AcrR family transcriptional regulator n=1 Tax=Nocardia sp. NBC_01327 TaxID=2903593 RepID=UPI002E15BBE4|nr:TetR/AcrR family transcriptional regulator [Nocardia sp. NBC_01327]
MARTRDAEQTGAARRAKIVTAALALFATRGYRGTSLAAVADAAGITRSGLLHHFSSKEALLAAALAERDEQAFDAVEIDRDYEGPALLRALEIIDGLVERNQSNRELTRLAHLGNLGAEDTPQFARDWAQERIRTFRENLAGVIAAGIAAGEVRADVDPVAVAGIVIAAMSGLEEQWLQDESFDMAGAMRTLTAVLRRDLLITQR